MTGSAFSRWTFVVGRRLNIYKIIGGSLRGGLALGVSRRLADDGKRL